MGSMERQRQSDQVAANEARSEPFPEGTSIARYKIVSLIGSGAMGDVYRAHDRALNRDIALKVLPPDLTGDRERVRRFAHEARAASALSHPHIVGIHEVGHAKPVIGVHPIDQKPVRRPEVHYISMELVEGETLREALHQGSMPLRRSVELLAQVADGLGKAHSAGIIHRDLKPDNILVSRDGYAKIVDFGLAKLTDTSWNPIGADSPTLRALTAHGELLGTPAYMAPEQIVGKPLDGRADIFAFGCILYEAISHARPFEAESFVDTLYKIIHEDPPPLGQIAPNTPLELQMIVDRCLAKDREARYQSIRDVAADLRQWHGESGARSAPILAAGPLQPRINARLALLLALIVAVPILAFIFLGRAPETVATGETPQASVRRITNDGHATQAVVSPDGRYVAYITSDANGRTMWLEQIATGRALTIIPAQSALYAGISFSRDGEYIYFTRYDGGPLGTLYRVPILGGTAEPLVKDVDSRATLSPENKELAFVRDDFNKGTSTILVAKANGTNVHELAQFKMPDRVMQPAWSPDGSQIVAIQQAKLVSVDVKTGAVRSIDTDIAFDGFRGLGWRDDKHLVTAATDDETGGHFRLFNIDITNGKATALTSDLTELWGPTVSENGAVTAIQVIRQSNLFEASANGAVKQLTSGVGSATGSSGVAWLGDRLVYASIGDGKMDLFIRKDNEVTRLTDDTAYEVRPQPSADGSFIAYVSSGGDTQTLWRVAPDGTNRVKLTNGPRDAAFALSPDSSSIAFASLDTKTNEWVLWVMPSNGGERRRIAARTAILHDIRYTPDGKTLIFTGYDKDMLRIYRVPVAGGRVEEVLDGRAHESSISPDGSLVAAASGSPDKIHSAVAIGPVMGGSAMQTIELDGAMYQWHPKGDALSYVREEKGAMNLFLRPLGAETSKQLTWFSEGVIIDYAWRRDGSQAVVARVVDALDVVLIR